MGSQSSQCSFASVEPAGRFWYIHRLAAMRLFWRP
jgi:hypothetical protein